MNVNNAQVHRPASAPFLKLKIINLPSDAAVSRLLRFCYVHSFALASRRLIMSIPPQPNIRLVNSPDYRDGYANSVQVRVSVWDFLLVFGRLQPQSADLVEVQNFQGIYLSPQQAKALLSILQQNVVQYENAFGEIKLDANIAQSHQQVH
jgi:flagellar protein FlaG